MRFKKVYLLIICSFILISCDNETNTMHKSIYNDYPPEIVAIIDSLLNGIYGASYYDCVKNEVYTKLKDKLTEEDIRAAKFQGKTNIKYMNANIGMQNKLASTVRYVLDNSDCIPKWK